MLENIEHLGTHTERAENQDSILESRFLGQDPKEEGSEVQGMEDPFSWLRKNGFVMPRMVRVRLFHCFLVPLVQGLSLGVEKGETSYP